MYGIFVRPYRYKEARVKLRTVRDQITTHHRNQMERKAVHEYGRTRATAPWSNAGCIGCRFGFTAYKKAKNSGHYLNPGDFGQGCPICRQCRTQLPVFCAAKENFCISVQASLPENNCTLPAQGCAYAAKPMDDYRDVGDESFADGLRILPVNYFKGRERPYSIQNSVGHRRD